MLRGLGKQPKGKCKVVFKGIVALVSPHEERYFDYRRYVDLNLQTRIAWSETRNEIIARVGIMYQRELASRMLVAKNRLSGSPNEDYVPDAGQIKREIGKKTLSVGALANFASRVTTEENKVEKANKRRRTDE